jgi:hypothetical protein
MPIEVRSSELEGVLVDTQTNVQSYGSYECQSWDVTSAQGDIEDGNAPSSLQPSLTLEIR